MSFQIELADLAQVNTVLAGLAELPAKTSYDVINSVKRQAETQIAATQVKEAAPAGQQLLTEDGGKSA
jgi:hypothetical protein